MLKIGSDKINGTKAAMGIGGGSRQSRRKCRPMSGAQLGRVREEASSALFSKSEKRVLIWEKRP